MFLIVGLGNPGKEYEATRHNLGFMAADFLISRFSFEKFILKNELRSEIAIGQIDGRHLIIAKPQTYMNESGQAVQLIKNYYKIQLENIIIVHDELDLPLGVIRTKSNGSSAGHNGLKSIMAYLATENFCRLRLGIGNDLTEKMPADKFVLQNFSFWERHKVKKHLLPEMENEILNIINV